MTGVQTCALPISLVVRGERERDFVPADVEVRVVPGFFREARDGVHKLDGCREILELVRSGDGLGFPPPIRHAGQGGFDLLCGQFRHDRSVNGRPAMVTAKVAM